MPIVQLPPELLHRAKIVDTIISRLDISVISIIEKDQKKVLKQYGSEAVFIREKEAISFLSKKLPTVPALHSSGHCWIVMDFIEGINMRNLGDTSPNEIDCPLLADFGKTLGQLHASSSIAEVNNEKFWHRTGYTVCSQHSWIQHLKATLKKWISRIKMKDANFEALVLGGYEYLVDNIDIIHKTIDLVVLHSDYQFRNVIIKNVNAKWQIKALLDFEHVLAGDAHFDLAKPFLLDLDELSDQEKESFLEGWCTISKMTLDRNKLRFYIIVHAIAAISWVDKQSHITKEHQQFKAIAEIKLRELLES